MKLNLGCGENYIEGFVNVDIDKNVKTDKILNLNVLPYPYTDNSIDKILCLSTIDYLSIDVFDFLKECYRILKPNGTLEIRMPNMFCLQTRVRYLFGKIDTERRIMHPYRTMNVFTSPKELRKYLLRIGFSTIENKLKYKFMSDYIRPHVYVTAIKHRV
jgi:predicted SAM-dependent methyltransferase